MRTAMRRTIDVSAKDFVEGDTMPPANTDSGDKRIARLEFRATSALKADIQRAATLMGMDDTSYALSVLGEHARATIESHHRTQLSQADSAAFMAALDSPEAPTDALRGLFELHRDTHRDGD